MKTVSLLSVTISSGCLHILKERIRAQTYDRICEWVIVAGDPDIQKIVTEDMAFPIIHVQYQSNMSTDTLIDHGYAQCKGDIVVYIEDTEYIHPDRVGHLVGELDRLGVDSVTYKSVYIYDFFLKKFFRSNDQRLHVYPQAWIRTQKIPTESTPIENKNKEIVFSHNSSVHMKRPILMTAIINVNPEIEILQEPVSDFISESDLQRYKEILYKEFNHPYDIVYYLSGFHKPFEPDSYFLRGSEQTVVHLSESWVQQGKKVCVYGNFSSTRQYKGVDYLPWTMFPFEAHFQTLILWNIMAIKTSLGCGVYAEKIWIDMHEPTLPLDKDMYQQLYKLPYIYFMLRSDYHVATFQKTTAIKLDKTRYQIVSYGLQDEFMTCEPEKRQPLRFHFCNCYSKGLGPILLHTWPIIKQAFFKAEFHVYGGMNFVPDEQFRTVMTELLEKTPGVYHHGLQDVRLMAKEVRQSSFHLFLTNATNEIDGLTIRESIANGCIPLISNTEIFKSQEGIHFNLQDTPESYRDVGHKIVDIIRNTDMEKFRAELSKKKPVTSWQQMEVIL